MTTACATFGLCRDGQKFVIFPTLANTAMERRFD